MIPLWGQSQMLSSAPVQFTSFMYTGQTYSLFSPVVAMAPTQQRITQSYSCMYKITNLNNNLTDVRVAQLSTENTSILIVPKVITHCAPCVVDAYLNSTLMNGGWTHSGVHQSSSTTDAWCYDLVLVLSVEIKDPQH